jgi:Helix-turn-helix domain
MTIIDDVRDVQRWNAQTRAVLAHLEKHGVIYKHECTQGGGLPGYGIIEHPGARIFDLREAGYVIKTLTKPTRWSLISKPGEQIPIPI